MAILLHLSAAGKILSTTKDTGTGSGAVACPTGNLCFMTDYVKPTTFLQVVTKGRIGAEKKFPADTYIQYISCDGSSICYALGGKTTTSPARTDEVLRLNPKTGSIGAPVTIGGNFDGVSIDCVNATVCLVPGFVRTGSGEAALVTVARGAAGKPVRYTGYNLDAAACAPSSRCYGVGLGSSSAVVDRITG